MRTTLIPVLNKPDSASRARQRLVFSGISFLLVFILAPTGSIRSDPVLSLLMILLGVYCGLAALQAWLLSSQRSHWEKIELPCYLLDLPLIAYALAAAGEYLALASPLLAMVALIRGIRYGPWVLLSHVVVGVLIMLMLVFMIPFWQEQAALVLANLFLLLVLPIQFYELSLKIQAHSKSLHQENLTDPLTRCLNRKALEAALWRLLGQKEPFVLSFLDLDNFKTVNDTLGHAVGDKLLKRVCSKLVLRLRVEDKVYRLSGDEFVILSMGPVREELAENLGQRIQSAIHEAVVYTCANLPVSASVGMLIVTGEQGESLEKLLGRADHLMYQAKKAGKNRVLVERV